MPYFTEALVTGLSYPDDSHFTDAGLKMAVLKGERKDKNGLTYGLNQIALEVSDVHQMKAGMQDFHFADFKMTFFFWSCCNYFMLIKIVQLKENMIARPPIF